MNDGWDSPGEASERQNQPKQFRTRFIGRSDGSGRGRTEGPGRGRSDGPGRGRSEGPGRGRPDGFARGRSEGSGGRGRGGWRDNNWRDNNTQPAADPSWGDMDQTVSERNPRGVKPNRRPGPNSPFIQIDVDSSMVGKIIGRGGSKITELQSESGAQIIITKEETDDGKIIVKLYGDEEATNKAKELIEGVTSSNNRSVTSNFSHSNNSSNSNLGVGKINWKELSEECDRVTKEMWSKCPPLKKNFYKEDPVVANFTESQIKEIRTNNNSIVVSRVFADKHGYRPIPNPVTTFEQCFQEYPDILEEIHKAGFERPSPIQCQAWPVLLRGEDLIGIAQTGTGKTLAFLLPALIHIEGQPVARNKRNGPNVLVLAPTRELALQIDREVKKYHYRNIKAVCVYGGGSRKEQVDIVTQGVEIIIATPGRLNDLVMSGYINVASITYLVLDEADRMLDMGFEPQIRKVLLDIRPDRQTIMTSATWPPGVRRLAESYMDNPVQVYVGSLDLAAVHTVTQTILIVEDDEEQKFQTFLNWVQQMEASDKAIIFCGKKARADFIASELVSIGIDCQSIHGDREQSDREQALVDISDGSVQILVATDVASRGIDIQDITHVINYDFPRNIEEYVHRVGRTGRAGRTGESITYMTRGDWGSARELIAILEEAEQYVPDELHAMAKRFEAMKERRDQERASGGGAGRFGGGFGGRGGGGRGRGGRW